MPFHPDLPPEIRDVLALRDAPAAATAPPAVCVAEDPLFIAPAEADLVRNILGELVSRKLEGLRLYQPLPYIDQHFHAVNRDLRLLRGSNRAGKTLGGAAEFARAVLGCDPYDKYPKRGLRCILVARDETDSGEVMYRKLFKESFLVLRDEATGAWRPYNPLTDLERKAQAVWTRLIPDRFIAGCSWEDKSREIPKQILLTNGSELNFFSSKAMPPCGWDIDLWWIDEECLNQSWFKELSARTLDRRGKGFWTATPQVANPQLFDLHIRAEEGDPRVGECLALLSDNPYIEQAAKDALDADCRTEEERRVRIKGEFLLSGALVYSEFSWEIHGIEGTGFQVPPNWCRYLVVDPGRQVCAVLFAAVPPPPNEQELWLYDELYIKQCDAAKFASAVKAKSAGIVYEGMLVDTHAARVTDMGSGKNIERQYLAALRREEVSCRNGLYFIGGLDDPKAGELAVREYLRLQRHNKPRLRVVRAKMNNWKWEIERYYYKRVLNNGQYLVTDQAEKKNDHLMDCTRYLCAYGPRYRKPKPPAAAKSPAVRALEAKRRRKQKGQEVGFIRLGPQGTAP